MSALGENAITRLATVTNIDVTSVAIVTLYTVPAGKSLVMDHVVVRVTSFTDGGKMTNVTASFGCNAPTYDDYLMSITFTIDTDDTFIRYGVDNQQLPVYAAGSVFRISIETASDATVEIWAVDVFGYLV